MNKFHRSIYLLILLILPINLLANISQYTADSILSIVDHSKKSERLQLLNKYSDLYPENLAIIKAFDKMAAQEGEQLYLAVAKLKQVHYYATAGNRDSMKYYLAQASNHLDKFAKVGRPEKINQTDKEKYQRSKLMAITTRATIYIDEGKYNLAISEIRKGLNDPIMRSYANFRSQVNHLTGIAYLYTKKPAEALAIFQKASEFDLESELKEKEQNINTRIGNYYYYTPMEGTVIAYNELKRYKDAINMADSLKLNLDKEYEQVKALKGNTANDDFRYNFLRNRILCYSAFSNICLKNTKTARQELDQVKAFLNTLIT